MKRVSGSGRFQTFTLYKYIYIPGGKYLSVYNNNITHSFDYSASSLRNNYHYNTTLTM